MFVIVFLLCAIVNRFAGDDYSIEYIIPDWNQGSSEGNVVTIRPYYKRKCRKNTVLGTQNPFTA